MHTKSVCRLKLLKRWWKDEWLVETIQRYCILFTRTIYWLREFHVSNHPIKCYHCTPSVPYYRSIYWASVVTEVDGDWAKKILSLYGNDLSENYCRPTFRYSFSLNESRWKPLQFACNMIKTAGIGQIHLVGGNGYTIDLTFWYSSKKAITPIIWYWGSIKSCLRLLYLQKKNGITTIYPNVSLLSSSHTFMHLGSAWFYHLQQIIYIDA
jgi:hypothetical protein